MFACKKEDYSSKIEKVSLHIDGKKLDSLESYEKDSIVSCSKNNKQAQTGDSVTSKSNTNLKDVKEAMQFKNKSLKDSLILNQKNNTIPDPPEIITGIIEINEVDFDTPKAKKTQRNQDSLSKNTSNPKSRNIIVGKTIPKNKL